MNVQSMNIRRKFGIIAGALCLSSGLVASVALAQSVHLKGSKKAEPAFTDNGLTLTARGALAGLGNGDVLIKLTATADATAVCINPGSGAHEPPGQNPAPVTVSGVQAVPADEIKNGNLNFSVTTVAPVSPIPGAPDCPNPQWTEVITDLAFKTATITVEQPAGTTVLTVSCTFSQPTSNGSVPAMNVSCTQS